MSRNSHNGWRAFSRMLTEGRSSRSQETIAKAIKARGGDVGRTALAKWESESLDMADRPYPPATRAEVATIASALGIDGPTLWEAAVDAYLAKALPDDVREHVFEERARLRGWVDTLLRNAPTDGSPPTDGAATLARLDALEVAAPGFVVAALLFLEQPEALPLLRAVSFLAQTPGADGAAVRRLLTALEALARATVGRVADDPSKLPGAPRRLIDPDGERVARLARRYGLDVAGSAADSELIDAERDGRMWRTIEAAAPPGSDTTQRLFDDVEYRGWRPAKRPRRPRSRSVK